MTQPTNENLVKSNRHALTEENPNTHFLNLTYNACKDHLHQIKIKLLPGLLIYFNLQYPLHNIP